MNILILNTSERTGGAAIAANRLMHALNKAGHEVKMLVRDKQTNDANVVSINTSWFKKKLNFIRFAYERWVIFIHNGFNRKELFTVSIANTGTNISKHPLVQEADIIHLHWINQGFLSLKNIRQLMQTGNPIVWTMHDMWACTGGCHYAGECKKNETECGSCSLLKSSAKHDLSHKTWKKKRFLAKGIHFVGCSRWIANCAKESALLRTTAITSIPNPIDVELFKPQDKMVVRQKFNLPANKKLILFAAAKLSDWRKGISYFVEACGCLQSQPHAGQPEVVLMGGQIDEQLLCQIPLKTHHLGYLHTPADIVAAYAACDVFVTASLSDNLPNTIMEAMACGTPCVGFDVGGIPEMIDHKQNGYVAEYKSAEDLADGIAWCLDNSDNSATQARRKVTACYAEDVVAKQYENLYFCCLKVKDTWKGEQDC
jgi:glycosyltransferase involved in cell wall biosynthesis